MQKVDLVDKTNNGNIPVLDSLRAFAALSVCLFHFVCTTTDYIQNDIVLKIFDVGQYGVQMFFVISGFVIPWAMYHARYHIKDFFLFFLKRITRLEPPYVFSIILALAVLFARERFLGKTNEHMVISAKQIMLHFGYLIPFFNEYKWLNTVYWTLAVEFQYYLLIALLFVPLTRSNVIIRGVIIIALILISFTFPENFLPFWLPIFLLGITLFLYKIKLIGSLEYYMYSLLLFVICFIKYPVASVFYTALPVIMIHSFEKLKIKGLHFAGKFSYSIYLIHPILGASLINLLSHRFVSPVQKVMVIIIGLIFTLISAYITYILIEKPSKKLSSSIKYKPRN